MNQLYSQFIKFCVTGTINAVIDFAVYLFLTRFFLFWNDHLALATGFSFIVANLNSYFMNKYWTFNSRNSKHINTYVKFILVSVIGLLINVIFFSLLTYIFNINDIVSKVLVAIIVLFWNFIVNKIWTFKQKVSY